MTKKATEQKELKSRANKKPARLKGKRAANDLKREDQKEQALELRLQGMNLRAIGKALGVSHETVRKWIDEEYEGSFERRHELADKLLDQSLLELEYMYSKVAPDFSQEDRKIRYQALDRGIKINESRRKLLGIDSPEKLDVNTNQKLYTSNIPLPDDLDTD
ncbi:helix-turn-helix domain-containing protein [Idiomarina piscisalsi]|uniref:Uncharacterized protein n=1 Tax=Idiomarina piscisalsi TaxID=1096243 RepID=A0A432YXF9_9GAMM|nr:helix-turn-helix domain-containing protein [Idiomarina piscisalsi]RUO68010.1 hypothetical protein CWI73_03900 [Idiomarina piscisalsi]